MAAMRLLAFLCVCTLSRAFETRVFDLLRDIGQATHNGSATVKSDAYTKQWRVIKELIETWYNLENYFYQHHLDTYMHDRVNEARSVVWALVEDETALYYEAVRVQVLNNATGVNRWASPTFKAPTLQWAKQMIQGNREVSQCDLCGAIRSPIAANRRCFQCGAGTMRLIPKARTLQEQWATYG
jgi:hypothetical protein